MRETKAKAEVESVAGRELDARIAREVMGWWSVRVEEGAWAGTDNRWHADWVGTRDGERTVLPTYSTDIAVAWEVVEKMEEGRFTFSIDNVDGSWQARFHGERGGISRTLAYAQAPTAPYAICRAAIAALATATPSPKASPESTED